MTSNYSLIIFQFQIDYDIFLQRLHDAVDNKISLKELDICYDNLRKTLKQIRDFKE